MAQFPWKPNHPPLPTNGTLCERKTWELAHQLAMSLDLLNQHSTILNNQEHSGGQFTTSHIHMSLHSTSCCQKGLANHVTQNCMIVAATNLVSHLVSMTAFKLVPQYLQDLCSIILWFQLHKFTISTEIEKMFLHVRLHKDDWDFTKFFWLSNPSDPESE